MRARRLERAFIVAATAAVAGVVCCYARDAHAYRPFDGTDADIADVGVLELELGPVQFYGRGEKDYLVTPATVLNLGIVRNLELVVDFKQLVGLEQFQDESRWRVLDTDVLLKWLVRRGALQEEHGLSIAIEAGPLVPEVHGERRFGAQANVILSHRSRCGTVHFNEQAALSRRGNVDAFSSVILEGPHEDVVRPVAEVFVEHEFGADSSTYSALVGAIWTVSESFSADIGLRIASIEEERAAEARLGFTWAIPVWSAKTEPTPQNARAMASLLGRPHAR